VKKRQLAAALVTSALVLSVIIVGCASSRPAAGGDGTGGGVIGSGGGVILTGPCATEGEKVECHVETGRVGDIVNCFSGSQVCEQGTWGPCGGIDGTLTARNLASSASAGSLHGLTVTASGPSADAGGCVANPCNPYCVGQDVDAGALAIGTVASIDSVYGVISDPSSFPGGVTGAKAAAMCGVKAGTSAAGGNSCLSTNSDGAGTNPEHFRCGNVPAGTTGAGNPLYCSYDYCCANLPAPSGTATLPSGTSHPQTCQAWASAGGTSPKAATCTKPLAADVTVGLGCASPDGHKHLPVCNRGQTDLVLTSALPLRVQFGGGNVNTTYNKNGSPAGTTSEVCNPGNPGADYCKIQNKTIKAGTCIDLDFNAASTTDTSAVVYCTSSAITGNTVFLVNPQTQSGYTHLGEASDCNNFSFFTSTLPSGAACVSNYGEPASSTTAYTYTGTCPGGTTLTWNQFAYNTSFPAGSTPGGAVTFTATTSGTTPVVVKPTGAASPPAVCPFSGPSPCPYSLASLPATSPLTLTVLIDSNGVVSPAVNSWAVTYNCVPTE
jgi:hypothetical protein